MKDWTNLHLKIGTFRPLLADYLNVSRKINSWVVFTFFAIFFFFSTCIVIYFTPLNQMSSRSVFIMKRQPHNFYLYIFIQAPEPLISYWNHHILIYYFSFCISSYNIAPKLEHGAFFHPQRLCIPEYIRVMC